MDFKPVSVDEFFHYLRANVHPSTPLSLRVDQAPHGWAVGMSYSQMGHTKNEIYMTNLLVQNKERLVKKPSLLDWKSGGSYKKGQIVRFENEYYRALTTFNGIARSPKLDVAIWYGFGKGPGGSPLCPLCLSEQGVHGGCSCGLLSPPPSQVEEVLLGREMSLSEFLRHVASRLISWGEHESSNWVKELHSRADDIKRLAARGEPKIQLWVKGASYKKGDLVSYENQIYCTEFDMTDNQNPPGQCVHWKRYGTMRGDCIQHQSKEGIIKERDEAVELLKSVCKRVDTDNSTVILLKDVKGLPEWWEKHREKTPEEKRLSSLRSILIEYGEAARRGITNTDDVAKIILSTLINDSLEQGDVSDVQK